MTGERSKTLQPKVIFLDAVGTIFGVKGSVGEVYAQIAQQFGVNAPADSINRAFYQNFKTAPPSVFPGKQPEEIHQYEFEWWEAIARNTFQQVGVIDQFIDFSAYFSQLYRHFATAEPWSIYPDVLQALQYWQQLDIELGVLSNFDSRLHSVLQALDLAQFFTSVTISTEVGAAKPEPQIFTVALNKHQCSAEFAWHVGDSLQEDYRGAKASGLRAIWLRRN
jgi:putative hydrolase of the HAD superfamily